MRTAQFMAEIYRHSMPVETSAWREWAGSENFLGTLRRRIARIGASPEALITAACADASAGKLSGLDAATRMTEVLAGSRAVQRGEEAACVLETLVAGGMPIADEYWSAVPKGETGRRLECGLRVRFQEKLPRLADRYFSSGSIRKRSWSA